jgi:proteic killer suppression protein
VIQSFRDSRTEALYIQGKHRDFANIANVASRKLDQLAAALVLDDLNDPPGNRLEALKADRAGQHSIRINDQYRLCFEWKLDGAHEVEIVDYH